MRTQTMGSWLRNCALGDRKVKALADDFDNAMMNVYRMAKEECAYNANMFLRMLHEHGGIETAHRLFGGETPQYGFTKLWECGRLDITVECIVLDLRYQALFDDHELETARRRLRQYGFDPEKCEQHGCQESKD